MILGVAGHYYGQMVQGDTMPSSHILGHSFALWYVWIPATPLIFAISRRRLSVPTMVAAHVLTLSAVFVLQSWLSVAIGHATGHVPRVVTLPRTFTGAIVNLLLYDVLIYGGVIAVAVPLRF